MSQQQAPRRKTGSILVCPLAALPRIVAESNARRLVTCLQDEIAVVRPEPIDADMHLRLSLHDITVTMPGHVAPAKEHIAELIKFALAWDGEGTMVVHCWAGISRSTAAAFTALCAINPLSSEMQIAGRLRRASPTAQPNRLMVEIADRALSRNGRMVSAIRAIGPGNFATEAVPFTLPADQS